MEAELKAFYIYNNTGEKMSKNRNEIKWGSALSYIQMALNIVIGLIYTPLMIRLLGQSEYGLYSTVSSTISTLSILSLGFNSSYIKYFSKYKKEKREDRINSLNGLFITIFVIIGIIALICGIFLTFHLDIVFSDGLTSSEYSTAKILMILLTINISISFPMSVFINIVSAHEKFVFLKLVGMLRTVAAPLIIIPLLYLGLKSIGLVLVTVIISLFADLLYLWFVLFRLKCKFDFTHFDFELFKELFVFSAFIALNMIVDQINTNIDKILLGRYKGTIQVAVYSVGASLQSYYSTFSTSISGVFTPRIHKIVNNNIADKKSLKKELTELFVKVGRIQFLILSLILSGLVFFGRPFILNIWAGKEYSDSYIVALLLIVPSTIPLIQNLGIEIQRALNLHKFRSIIYSFMAIANLILSIYLCKIYGAVGSAFGTFLAVLIANGLIMNVFYHKYCSIDMIAFWKNILQIGRGLIIPLVFGTISVIYVNMEKTTTLLICIVMYSIVYFASVWWLGMNDYEKNLVYKPLHDALKKLTKKTKGE